MKKILVAIMIVSMFSGMMPLVAVAQNYDIKEMTPAIRSALDGRRARFNELETLKQANEIGENKRGYVEVLVAGQEASAVAADENRDRGVIYKAIAEQNNLVGAMDTIEDVFAEVQRSKAQPGQRIQLKDGQWVSK